MFKLEYKKDSALRKIFTGIRAKVGNCPIFYFIAYSNYRDISIANGRLKLIT